MRTCPGGLRAALLAACILTRWMGPARVAAEALLRAELRGGPGRYELLRDAKPYWIQGAGGDGPLALLAQMGGNSGRTWGADDLEARLDEAQRLGLTLAVGIWLGHPRRAIACRDAGAVAAQCERVQAAILRYKDHPAVLMWGIGNEMESPGDDAAIWSHANSLAALAKRLDPGHPTMTVIADLGRSKVKNLHRLCPEIDIGSISAYGGGATVGERYLKDSGPKPYLVTEFGPAGTWEVGRAALGAPRAPTSTQVAAAYRDTRLAGIQAHRGDCLGSYAFVWGPKVEATATWFGMLLPDGTRLGPVDALSTLGTSKPPANRFPTLEPLDLAPTDAGAAGGTLHATLAAADPEGDVLSGEWTLLRETGPYETGGDAQPLRPPRGALPRLGPGLRREAARRARDPPAVRVRARRPRRRRDGDHPAAQRGGGGAGAAAPPPRTTCARSSRLSRPRHRRRIPGRGRCLSGGGPGAVRLRTRARTDAPPGPRPPALRRSGGRCGLKTRARSARRRQRPAA